MLLLTCCDCVNERSLMMKTKWNSSQTFVLLCLKRTLASHKVLLHLAENQVFAFVSAVDVPF